MRTSSPSLSCSLPSLPALWSAQARAAAPPGREAAARQALARCSRRAERWRVQRIGRGAFRVRPAPASRRARRAERAWPDASGAGVCLWSLWPLAASCGCLEFAHLRLGVCVHVAAVLRALALRRRVFGRPACPDPPPRGPRLSWQPLLPQPEAEPAGLARVRLTLGRDGRRNGPCATLVERWLQPAAEDPRRLQPRPAALATPRARSGLVHALARAQRAIERRASSRRPAAAWGRPEGRPQAPLADGALARLLDDELHRLVQVTTQARSDARAWRAGALPDEARAFLAAGHAAFARTDEPARRSARAAARRLWRSGHVGRGLVVVPAARLGTWERRWPARLPLARLTQRAHLVRGFLLVGADEARPHARWLASWEPDLVIVEQGRGEGRGAPVDLPESSWRLALLHPDLDPGQRRALERWLDPWSTAPRWWEPGRSAARGAA